MEQFTGLYDIRDFSIADKNFILSTFKKGLYYGNTWFNAMPKQVFMDNYKVVAEALLDPTRTTIKVACLKDDRDSILGYSILSKDLSTLHWVYVKSSKLADGTTWRKHGIGRSLVPSHINTVTHLTELGSSLLEKLNANVTFNPFKLG